MFGFYVDFVGGLCFFFYRGYGVLVFRVFGFIVVLGGGFVVGG